MDYTTQDQYPSNTDYEPFSKRRIEYVSPPFSGYSCQYVNNSDPHNYVKAQYQVKEENRMHYKTVYPVRASKMLEYSSSSIIQSNYQLTSDGINNYRQLTDYDYEILTDVPSKQAVTPIKFSSLKSGSIDRARIDATSLSQVSHSGLIPLTSEALKPGILRRKRRHSQQENLSPLYTSEEDPCSAELKQPVIINPATPIRTPVKTLPFSPSRFFNSPSGPSTNQAITSTPMCNNTTAITPTLNEQPVTPNYKSIRTPTIESAMKENHPKTPTPFKKALADLERRSGIVRTEHHTPIHIHDDLQDVIAQDTGTTIFQTSLNRRFGSYRFVNGVRGVQQNLEKRLSAFTDAERPSVPNFKPETPSKSLIGDTTLVFSPPSIFKDSIYASPKLNDAFSTPASPLVFESKPLSKQSVLDNLPPDTNINFSKKPGFMMIACGRTENQLYLTNLARHWMRIHNSCMTVM